MYDTGTTAAMRAEEIKDKESFEAWLTTRPKAVQRQEAILLAQRCVLRVMPFLRRKGSLPSAKHVELLIGSIWATIVSRVAITTSIREISEAARTADDNIAAAADAASRTTAEGRAPNIRAAYAISHASYAAACVSGSDAAAASARTADTVGSANEAAFSTAASRIIFGDDTWSELRADAIAIETGVAMDDILYSRIWLPNFLGNPQDPSWWAEEYAQFSNFLQSMRGDGWDIWDEWFDDVFTGGPVFRIRTKSIRDTLERNIALGSTDGKLNEAFWKREDVKAINTDIKRWVKEAREEDRQIPGVIDLQSALDAPVETQNSIAPTFTSEGPGPVDHDLSAGQPQVANTPSNRDGHAEVRRTVLAILALKNTEGFSSNNDNQTAYDRAELLLEAMGSSINDIRPALVIPRGEALRQLLAKQESMSPLSDVPPCSETVRDTLELWKAAYNPFVALDPELAKRDEAIVGPDAKRVQISPDEARAKARSAFNLGAITPGAERAIAENADIAPPIPDAGNRNSRRLTEGVKNLLRALARKLQVFALWVKANPRKSLFGAGGSLLTAAKFAVSNEAWFLRVFEGNETMLSIINPIMEFLKTLPLL